MTLKKANIADTDVGDNIPWDDADKAMTGGYQKTAAEQAANADQGTGVSEDATTQQPSASPAATEAPTEPSADAAGQTVASEFATNATSQQAKTEAPADASGNAGAITPANGGAGALADHQSGGMTTKAMVEQDGMGDLDIGFGSFPIISLPQGGQFKSSEGYLGTEFEAVLMGGKAKHIYKVSEKEFVYSYEAVEDNPDAVTTKGDSLRMIINAWRQRNLEVQRKDYRDVTAMILTGPMEGQFALLSIPQTSVQRLDGYRLSLSMMKKMTVQQVVTKVSVGPLVTKAAQDFHPWNFNFARPYDG